MKNESYICFRRRDTKAIRKTRAAQVSSSEKMLRLKGEIGHATELARTVLQREVMKKDAHLDAKAVWEKRISFLELKRKFPLMGGREDDEMLVDKERPPKRPKPEPAPYVLFLCYFFLLQNLICDCVELFGSRIGCLAILLLHQLLLNRAFDQRTDIMISKRSWICTLSVSKKRTTVGMIKST